MNLVVYDRSFNANEWFVIAGLVILYGLIFITPKVLTALERLAFSLYGVYWGILCDHTLSIPPWDFYDVNDVSRYGWMDFLSYLLYAPYSYFFIYFYARWNIKGYVQHAAYIIAWVGFALFMGGGGKMIGLFHYTKGYSLSWSAMIYLFVQSLEIVFYLVYQRFYRSSSGVERRAVND